MVNAVHNKQRVVRFFLGAILHGGGSHHFPEICVLFISNILRSDDVTYLGSSSVEFAIFRRGISQPREQLLNATAEVVHLWKSFHSAADISTSHPVQKQPPSY